MALSGEPVEKTRLLHISQDLNLMRARNAHMFAIPELNWCLEPRMSAGRNANLRRSSANEMPNATSLHNRQISHEAAELILRNQAGRTDEEISWYHTRKPPSRLAAWARERVFLHTVHGAVNAGGALSQKKSQCDGSGESRQKARRKLVT